MLRSLGVTRLQLTRCFVYETARARAASACAICAASRLTPPPQVSSMFASIFSGTFIGLGFAVVLTYQQVQIYRRGAVALFQCTC